MTDVADAHIGAANRDVKRENSAEIPRIHISVRQLFGIFRQSVLSSVNGDARKKRRRTLRSTVISTLREEDSRDRRDSRRLRSRTIGLGLKFKHVKRY